MSGIDKLEFTVPVETTGRHKTGYPLNELLRTATLSGHTYLCKYLQSERKYVIGLSGYSGLFIGYDSKYKNTERSDNFVNKIILNPSRFSTFKEMMDVLGSLGIKRIQSGAIVASRIDFAADYICSMDEILSSLDVLNIQKSTLYIGENSGGVETYYAGRKKDVLSVYDRNQLPLFSDEVHPANCIRIERQLRDKSTIYKKFGYHITPLNIRDALGHILSDRINIFADRVDLGHLTPSQLSAPTSRQIQKQQELLILSRFASYAVARRRLNDLCNDNFQRQYTPLFNRVPFATYNQPDYILRKSIAEYMGTRTRLPIPREGHEPLMGLYRNTTSTCG